MNVKSISINLTTLVLIVGFFSGCVSCPKYAVVLQNVGGRELDDACVVYGNFKSVEGILSKGGVISHGHVQEPIPKIATVEWKDVATGVMHKKEVKVKESLPLRFSGKIYFKIDDNGNVTVVPVPYQDKK